jgi:hypothetical protein
MNFSGTVGRINLILFALESLEKDVSFDYNTLGSGVNQPKIIPVGQNRTI